MICRGDSLQLLLFFFCIKNTPFNRIVIFYNNNKIIKLRNAERIRL